MAMRRRVLSLLLPFSLAVSADALEAAAWVLRLEGMRTDYSRETFSGFSTGYRRLELDGGRGFGIAAEVRVGRQFGLELSASRVDLDAESRRVEYGPNPVPGGPPIATTTASDSGDFTLLPLAVAAYWHPLHGRRVDLYLGPQIARVDFELGVDGPPRREAEWALGAKVGAEVALGRSPWSAGVALRYLETDHDGVERDPYTGIGIRLVSVVVAYRIGQSGR